MHLRLMNPPESPDHRGRTFVEFAVVIVCTLAFAAFALGICVLMLTGNRPGGRDFISFWAAGRQIVHHANPYDGARIFQIERSLGFPDGAQVLIMRNPPSALCLVMPLGLLGPRSASLFWSLLLLAAFAVSVHMLWVMHGRPDNKLHLLGYSFAPALACIFGGQTSLFALLGFVLFLRLPRKHPFLAGLSLWLCALKPHLFLVAGAALILWVVVSRSYRILAGLALAVISSSLVASYLDPSVWVEYRQMMHSSGLEHEFIPCLGVALRFVIDSRAMWLQYIPAVIGCAWAVHFYLLHRDRWEWMEHGALLMLVSILLSPYAWFTDQALLIPALLAGAYCATSRGQIEVLALASAVIEIEQLSGVTMHSALLLWTAPLWVGWYLYVSSRSRLGLEHRTLPQGGVL